MEKTNEQLHQEFQDALKNLSEKIYNLLHYGSYQLEYVNRDFETQAVTSATMRAKDSLLFMRLDERNKYLEAKGTEVTVTLPDNPLDQKILDAWDTQSIDNEIAYHIKKLEALQKQKSNLQEKYGKDEGSE
jgi:BMFP domain-containing protein YqiC